MTEKILKILPLLTNRIICFEIAFKDSVRQRKYPSSLKFTTQPAFIYSKLTIETLEQGVKYVQS